MLKSIDALKDSGYNLNINSKGEFYGKFDLKSDSGQ